MRSGGVFWQGYNYPRSEEKALVGPLKCETGGICDPCITVSNPLPAAEKKILKIAKKVLTFRPPCGKV